MKKRFLFLVLIILTGVMCAVAQSRTVTNSDLEKYRQQRLDAEADLRENYAKLGFPSPQELDRRREQSRVETERLAAKLREERLARERLDAERQAIEQQTEYVFVERDSAYVDPYYPYYSYYTQFRRPMIRQGAVQQGYFAGGQFWPTGSRAKPRPLLVPPHH